METKYLIQISANAICLHQYIILHQTEKIKRFIEKKEIESGRHWERRTGGPSMESTSVHLGDGWSILLMTYEHFFSQVESEAPTK